MRTALALFLALAPGLALADDCETVKAALDRLAAAPAIHQTVTMGDEAPMQLVALGDTMYIDQGTGAWMKVPLQPGMRAQMMAQALPDATALSDCRQGGTEEIAGVATTIYEYMPPSFGGEAPQAQKLWIGDADGLPYRMTSMADGKPMAMTVVYDGVVAPMP